jgi:hypothetical protein
MILIYHQMHSRIHVHPTKTPISQLTIIKPHSEAQRSRRNYITHVPTADIFRPTIIIIIIIVVVVVIIIVVVVMLIM